MCSITNEQVSPVPLTHMQLLTDLVILLPHLICKNSLIFPGRSKYLQYFQSVTKGLDHLFYFVSRVIDHSDILNAIIQILYIYDTNSLRSAEQDNTY